MTTRRVPALDPEGNIYDKHLPDRLSDAELRALVESIVATGGGTSQLIARKAADTVRNNTATRADDPELVLAVEPGTYILDALLVYRGTTTADMRFEVTAPAGTSLSWTPNGPHASTSGTAVNVSRVNITAGAAPVGAIATSDLVASPVGTLVVTEAGNVTISWAQDTAEVSDLTMRAGSYLRLVPVPET